MRLLGDTHTHINQKKHQTPPIKYVDGNDEHKLEFQAKPFPNGEIWFIYHNIVLDAKKAAERTGYPVIIGLQNSFAGKDKETTKGGYSGFHMSIYLYKSY